MKKLLGLGALASAIGLFAVARARPGQNGGRLAFEVQKHAHRNNYREHTHPAMVHEQGHPHVTHDRRQGANAMIGEWEHLTSVHGHEHNHPEVTHSHLPHQDVEHEHEGEAHIHDHSHPAQS